MGSDARKRSFEIDAVKFFAVIFMICAHAYERFGAFEYEGTLPDSLYRNLVEFCGGPLAAPVFMFCMGIGMVYTRHGTPSDLIRRGIRLLLTGYLLNFFRQTVPMLIAMALHIGSVTVATLLGLLLPSGEHVAFPMTLWLIYPTAGIMFGEMLKASEDRRSLYVKALIASSAFFVSYNAALICCGYDIRLIYALYEGSYYYQTLISTLWILPIVMIALSLSYLVLSSIEQTLIGRFMRYCSINLTTIYIIQWLLIGYGTGVGILLGFTSTDSPIVITMIAAALMVSAVLISLICVKVKGRKVKAAAKSAA